MPAKLSGVVYSHSGIFHTYAFFTVELADGVLKGTGAVAKGA